MDSNHFFAKLTDRIESSIALDLITDASGIVAAFSTPNQLPSLTAEDGNGSADINATSEALNNYIPEMLADLRAYERECRAQARISYVLTIIMAPVTCFSGIAGLALYSKHMPPSAIASWACTFAFGSMLGLFFRIYRNESKRVDAIMHDVRLIQNAWLSSQLRIAVGPGDRDAVSRQVVERARKSLREEKIAKRADNAT